eukprot:gene22803-biopygen8235
MSRGGVRDRNR